MARQALVLLFVVLTFGILVPWYKGATFLQPWTIVVYACMALLFVAPAAAEFWASNPALASPSRVLSRLAMLVGYAWGIAVVTLITAVLTINLNYRGPKIFIPEQSLSAAALVFSLIASTAVAALSAVLARRFSAGTVKSILRAAFLLVLFAFAFGHRLLPEYWQIVIDNTTRRALTRLAWEGSAIFAVIAAIMLVLLLRRPASNPA